MCSVVSNAFLGLLFHFVPTLKHFSKQLPIMHRLSCDCFNSFVAIEYAYMYSLYYTVMYTWDYSVYFFSKYATFERS